MQDCVSAYSKAFNLHWITAFGEGYVISKTKVKWNLLVVVIDYFKKYTLSNSEREKKGSPKKQYDTILTKE